MQKQKERARNAAAVETGDWITIKAVSYTHLYCEHDICPMETQLPNATDTIHINKDLHLQQVAEVCNINLDVYKRQFLL